MAERLKWPAALVVLGIVGLLYAIGQNAGWLPDLSGVSPIVLAFFGIVGIVIGAYFGSED